MNIGIYYIIQINPIYIYIHIYIYTYIYIYVMSHDSLKTPFFVGRRTNHHWPLNPRHQQQRPFGLAQPHPSAFRIWLGSGNSGAFLIEMDGWMDGSSIREYPKTVIHGGSIPSMGLKVLTHAHFCVEDTILNVSSRKHEILEHRVFTQTHQSRV